MKGSQWIDDLKEILTEPVTRSLQLMDKRILENMDELRLRARKPLMVQTGNEDWYVDSEGKLSRSPRWPLVITEQDVMTTLQKACQHSIYAYEQELKQGYLTVQGGYRIGLSGQINTKDGDIVSIPYCSGLCIRLMRQMIGCADWLMPWITAREAVYSTLIISPPMMGKTTLLRDIARQISNGVFGTSGQKVCIVDERSELGGSVCGVAQLDVGIRTDILDGCPKAKGMSMALRTLSPHVIVTDELGDAADAQAVLEASYAGVKVIATAHGNDEADLYKREGLAQLLHNRAFDRIVVLGGKPGQIQSVLDGSQNPIWVRKVS